MGEVMGKKRTTLMLCSVLLAMFVDCLDLNIMNVALPEIGESVGVDTATVSWITVIYSMILAGMLVAFAKISKRIGVRKVLSAGIITFTVGSALCAFSYFTGELAFYSLLASRIVQAMGASMLGAAAPMCVTINLPANRLGFGMAIVSVGGSLGFTLGPALGGILIEYLPWYWLFLINIPIGIVTLLMILYSIPGPKEVDRTHSDLLGAALLFGSVSFGTLALESAPHPDKYFLAVVSAIICVATLFMFIIVERKSRDPLLRMSTFHNEGFSSIFLCLLFMNFMFMGVFYILPFYCGTVMGYGSFDTGMMMLVASAVTLFTSMQVAAWSDRRGRRWFCVTAASLEFTSFMILALLAEDMEWWMFLLPMALMGLGWSFTGGPMASRLVEHSGDDPEMASSLTMEAYYIGSILGIALAAIIFSVMSGSEGTAICDLSVTQMLNGFIPVMAMMMFVSILVGVMSVAVKDREALPYTRGD